MDIDVVGQTDRKKSMERKGDVRLGEERKRKSWVFLK
jgi:hypothetical protein